MATGFDKFKEKTLSEKPINIGTAKAQRKEEETNAEPERKQVETLSRAAMVGLTEHKKETPEQKEKLFQVTIKIKDSTKDKLDWLKFITKKKFMEIAEEAFDDIYNKYRNSL